MTKQEQIEEMANYYCEYCKKQTGEKFCEHIDDKSCNIFFEAELFYNAGYRKIPEDSVVLSREEYKRLLDNAIRVDMEYLDHELAKTRKETAKEIFYRVVNICRKEIDFQDGTINTQLEPLYFGIINGCDFVMDEVKRLAKQYSVEVEE